MWNITLGSVSDMVFGEIQFFFVCASILTNFIGFQNQQRIVLIRVVASHKTQIYTRPVKFYFEILNLDFI